MVTSLSFLSQNMACADFGCYIHLVRSARRSAFRSQSLLAALAYNSRPTFGMYGFDGPFGPTCVELRLCFGLSGGEPELKFIKICSFEAEPGVRTAIWAAMFIEQRLRVRLKPKFPNWAETWHTKIRRLHRNRDLRQKSAQSASASETGSFPPTRSN